MTRAAATGWSVAFLAGISATLCTGVIALVVPGSPTAADLAWAVLAGLGSGVGTGFLYRGFASGRMGVVAPVSAVGAAVVGVDVGRHQAADAVALEAPEQRADGGHVVEGGDGGQVVGQRRGAQLFDAGLVEEAGEEVADPLLVAADRGGPGGGGR